MDPIPDERMGPVEAYLRAWLQPMLAALNAEGGEASPAEEFSTAMAECVDKELLTSGCVVLAAERKG